MHNTIPAAPLTSDDIRALRQSSRWISFHARWTNGELVESYIRGTREDAEGNDYTSAHVPVAATFSYGGAIVRDNPDVRAYMSVMCPTVHEYWRTLLAYVRAGDTLVLMFDANGHRNGHVRSAGLAADAMSVRVTRGKRQMTFFMDSRVTAYDSARAFTLADTFSPVTSDRDTDHL